MSKALYKLGGLRFWNEREIILRNQFVDLCTLEVKQCLLDINPAWSFVRCETPAIIPDTELGEAYTDDDVFYTNHNTGLGTLVMRPETTKGSYKTAQQSNIKLPLCVWQSGKSYRRETNDGASASKLRFNEFYQLEYQCIYAENTKADYRGPLIESVSEQIKRTLGINTGGIRIVDSDRLPSYSSSTLDIEVCWRGKFKEVASCSIRTDYPEAKVCEIAIGLDRIVEMIEAAPCKPTREDKSDD